MGKKTKAKAAPEAAPTPLTAEQANFVRINQKILDDKGLAGHLGVPESDVKAHREALAARPSPSTVGSLMDRPLGSGGRKTGAVAMSGAAASAADDWKKMGAGAATVTQTDINAALGRRDMAEAERLTQMRDQQVRDADSISRARHRDRYHYLDGK